jgi:hypothetical protein
VAKFTYKNIRTSVIKPRIVKFDDYEDSKLTGLGITVKVSYDPVNTELILNVIKEQQEVTGKLLVEYIPTKGIHPLDQIKAEKLIDELCSKLR